MTTKGRFVVPLAAVMASAISMVSLGGRPAWSADALDGFMRVAKPGQRATVEGVVSAVWPDAGRLGLIDAEEFRKCGVVTCAQMTLPVAWGGPMPAVASTVHVVGEVTKKGMRLLFVAETLETVAPPPGARSGK